VARRRDMSLTLAIYSQIAALSIVLSTSFASRRLRFSQARVRSTTITTAPRPARSTPANDAASFPAPRGKQRNNLTRTLASRPKAAQTGARCATVAFTR